MHPTIKFKDIPTKSDNESRASSYLSMVSQGDDGDDDDEDGKSLQHHIMLKPQVDISEPQSMCTTTQLHACLDGFIPCDAVSAIHALDGFFHF